MSTDLGSAGVAAAEVTPPIVTNSVVIKADSTTGARTRRRVAFGFRPRLAALILLTVAAYGGTFYDTASSIVGGSRSAYLLAMPVLLAMIAYGRRTTPTANSDGEADWILGIILGGFALVLSYLAGRRFPTQSGMWNLVLIDAAVFTAFVATILFGFRRVWQLWPLWILATFTLTPFPSLLLTAQLGGTDAAASAVAAMIGAVAVFLAGWRRPVRWRLAAGTGCALAGVAAALALPGVPLPISVTMTAGAIPLLSFALLQRFTTADARQMLLKQNPVRGAAPAGNTRGTPHVTASPWPHRSPSALLALAAIAGAHGVIISPASAAGAPLGSPAQAATDWISRAELVAEEDFDFIQRYLGPASTFTRYAIPPEPGYPTAAVDVITAPRLDTLRTTRDVVWHPAPAIPSYRATDLGSAIPNALVLATDSAAATSPDSTDWYALSWFWTAGDTYQQVFIVVNQNPPPHSPAPPHPVPPSFRLSVLAPILWMSRQQGDPETMVDAVVSDRARHVANTILLAAEVGNRLDHRD